MFTGFGYEKKGRGCKIKLNNVQDLRSGNMIGRLCCRSCDYIWDVVRSPTQRQIKRKYMTAVSHK
jgi:hypothetical protein